jgi:hypothetical protein
MIAALSSLALFAACGSEPANNVSSTTAQTAVSSKEQAPPTDNAADTTVFSKAPEETPKAAPSRNLTLTYFNIEG